MSTTKEEKPAEEIKEEVVLKVHPGGNTSIDFFPVSFSEFIIDYVYGKKDRERMAITGCRKIFCG